jgi:hypothetical protein
MAKGVQGETEGGIKFGTVDFDVEHPSWRVYTRYIFQFLREEISHDQHFSLLYSESLSDQVSAYVAVIRLCKNIN